MAGADRPLSTGSPDLDLILGGGVPRGSTIAIAGPPGSGKTVLAQQLAFRNATPENPALYYTSWSEPHTKLVRNLRRFDFFDEQAIGQRIDFLHLPAMVHDASEGLEQVTHELLRASVEREPVLAVIDSSKSLHGLVAEERLRKFFYELASRVGQTETTLLLVGEYTPAEIESEPEFAVADGIIQLANEPGLIDRRWVRIVKMRGSAHLSGRHAFSIEPSGVRAYPRMETIVPPPVKPEPGLCSLGDMGIDEQVGGGLPRGGATLLLGPAGIGKTVLSLAFVNAGLDAGETALYMSLQETPAELEAKAGGLRLDALRPAVERGQVELITVRPVELELDAVAVMLRDALARLRPARVVIDSIAELDLGSRAPDRFLSYLWALVSMVRAHGATGIFTQEVVTFGPPHPALAVSHIFQNVLTMRFVEHDYRILRSISTLKMRENRHNTDLLEFEIGRGGITSGDRLTHVSGLLGWTALRKED